MFISAQDLAKVQAERLYNGFSDKIKDALKNFEKKLHRKVQTEIYHGDSSSMAIEGIELEEIYQIEWMLIYLGYKDVRSHNSRNQVVFTVEFSIGTQRS